MAAMPLQPRGPVRAKPVEPREPGASDRTSASPARSPLPQAFLEAKPGGGPESSARTWVYAHVSGAIVDGLLWPGTRLPSARALSLRWGLARGAVDEALMRLAREGLLERRVGRGSFVARRLPPGIVREVSGRAALALPVGAALDGLAPLIRINAAAPAGGNVGSVSPPDVSRLMLNPRVPSTEFFPLAVWRRCMAAAHAESDRSSLCYGLPAGWPPLREATARHLALTRGIECSGEQVIVLNGPVQALDLVVRVLLEPGDSVMMERPGSMSIARTVGLPPLDLRGAPVDDEGLDVEAARRACPSPALIYLHPLHQYPTGARLSMARRSALLGWAGECRAWVIEVDHLGEFVHDGPVPPTLFRSGVAQGPTASAPGRLGAAATGDDGQVLFLGTFNGVMFQGLRLSYLVVPRRLVPAFTAVRGLFGDHAPVAPQQALTRFIEGGHLSAYVRRMRGVYRRRRDAAAAAARRHLPPEVRLGPLMGATHGCIHLPPGCADEPLVQRLADAGFGVEMLSTYSWPDRGTSGLVFGYGADEESRIDGSMRLLATFLREALQESRRVRTSRGAQIGVRSVALRRG